MNFANYSSLFIFLIFLQDQFTLIQIYTKLKIEKEVNPFVNALKPINEDVKLIKNQEGNRVKFIKDSEKEAFSKWINS